MLKLKHCHCLIHFFNEIVNEKRKKKSLNYPLNENQDKAISANALLKKDNLVTVLWGALTNCSETVTIS